MDRFRKIKKKKTIKGKNYYRETFIVPVPERESDMYFITEAGDRLDLLAYEFYKDISLWWVLAAANPTITRRDSYVIEPGKQFRVPMDPQLVIAEYNQFNNNR